MIFSKNISKTLWPEAIAYACYIKNRSPMCVLGSNTMPYEVFYNQKPNITRLQEFGIQCWIMVPEQRHTKLDPKAEQHIFTGIADNAKAWRYYNTWSKIIQTSRNVIFNKQDTSVYPIPGEEEEEMRMNPPVILAATITEVDDVDQAPMPNMEAAAPSMGMPEPGPWHSSRIANQGARPDYSSTHNRMSCYQAMVMREIITKPENLKEAEGQLDWPIWKQAMAIEMDQHNKVGTWELVELPMGWTAIGCQWVYAVKTKLDGDFEKAKARLVTQGFTRRPGMAYYDITSPVVKFDSIRMILAMANHLDWEIEMMDVKGAYLNSILNEEIYMAQPSHFNDGSGRILKLVQAIYGLKQAGCVWHQKLCHILENIGFSRSTADECVYITKAHNSTLIIMIYNDLGLFTTSKNEMAELKKELKDNFTMTDLGEMKKILGIQVIQDRKAGTLKIMQS